MPYCDMCQITKLMVLHSEAVTIATRKLVVMIVNASRQTDMRTHGQTERQANAGRQTQAGRCTEGQADIQTS